MIDVLTGNPWTLNLQNNKEIKGRYQINDKWLLKIYKFKTRNKWRYNSRYLNKNNWSNTMIKMQWNYD
jgi:hypothetical protein